MSTAKTGWNCLRCRRKARSRGLCSSCYRVTSGCVREGLTSWSALEKRNKSLPEGRQVRQSAIKQWFLEGGAK